MKRYETIIGYCDDCGSEMDSDDWIKTLDLEWQEAHYFEIAGDRE